MAKKLDLVIDSNGAIIRSPAIGGGEARLKPDELRKLVADMTAACVAFFPPEDTDLSGKIENVIPDPRWFVQSDRTATYVLLSIHDPRFGWLTYALPPESAVKAAIYMQAQGNSILTTPKPRPM